MPWSTGDVVPVQDLLRQAVSDGHAIGGEWGHAAWGMLCQYLESHGFCVDVREGIPSVDGVVTLAPRCAEGTQNTVELLPDGGVKRLLETWRNRLLDLTGRNRLLNHKARKTTSLRVKAPSLYQVADELDEDGSGWEMSAPDDTDEEPARGVLIVGVKDDEELQKRLRSLERKARTELEEIGAHVLYLTAGQLVWRETASSSELVSPLLLFPVELRRDRLTTTWRLEPAADEEIVLNPALAEKIRRTLGVELPPLPEPEEVDRCSGDLLCESYFGRLDDFIAETGRSDWKVREHAWIDIFTFQKLAMYTDLRQNLSQVAAVPVVRSISGERLDAEVFGPPVVEALDGKAEVLDAYHVLDADGSQTKVLRAARSGTSVVLIGPPGTGKSQTIANLIAQHVALGKSVLFVSEKMAALEVVYRRLEGAQLGPLCLELHSHKAKKTRVIEELGNALSRRFVAEPEDPAVLDKLATARQRLNQYSQAAHERREPMARTVFEVAAEIASLGNPPIVEIGIDDVASSLDAATWGVLSSSADQLASVWPVMQRNSDSPWRQAKARPYNGQIGSQIQKEIAEISDAVGALQKVLTAAATTLGQSTPDSLGETEAWRRRLQLMEQVPQLPSAMLTRPVEELRRVASEAETAFTELSRLESALQFRPSGQVTSQQFAACLADCSCQLQGLRPPAAISELGALASSMRRVSKECEALNATLSDIATLFGSSVPSTWLEAGHLVTLARAILAGQPIPRLVVTPAGLRRAEERFASRRPIWERAAMNSKQLQEAFECGVLKLDLDRLVRDFRTRYNSWLRFFFPSFYRDRREVRGLLRTSNAPALLSALEQAKETRDALAEVSSGDEQDKQCLGDLARGSETDGGGVERALQSARSLLTEVPESYITEQTRALLARSDLLPPDVRARLECLIERADAFDQSLAKLPGAPSVLPGTIERSGFSELSAWADHAARACESVIQHAKEAGASQELTPQAVLDTLHAWDGLRERQNQVARCAEAWQPLFPNRFRGQQTDWDAVRSDLADAERIRALPGLEISDQLVRVLGSSDRKLPSADSVATAFESFRSKAERLAERFTSTSPWSSVEELSRSQFQELSNELHRLAETVNDLAKVMMFGAVRGDLERVGYRALLERLVASDADVSNVAATMKRSVLQAWLDEQMAIDPRLRTFEAEQHERAISEFAQRDLAFWQAGPLRVVYEYARLRPSANAELGEAGLLRRQAGRKRGQMSLRRLFSEIPTLLPRIKPCLLMSPLSVAQYLKDSEVMFDLVVFDEASQIKPEDAVGALARGRQVVVCGDPKQLPPTAFFDKLVDEEETDVYSNVDSESILDACLASGMPTVTLNWHYRSQHESLISFSNDAYYDRQLITFPSACEGGDLGLSFEHVATGRYDRGASRTNAAEAERIAELVIRHWKEHGGNLSLGVVTLSQAQQVAVEDAVEKLARGDSSLESLLLAQGAEPFRVKNLENVQGDERDVMILGIGYGPDGKGKISTNFGPINKAGGHRRLNVAITRARRQLIVVASMHGEDIPLTESSALGAKQLAGFLTYAAVSSHSGVNGTELPSVERGIVDSVACVLEESGYTVERGWGEGPSPLDLAVRQLEDPDKFVLGIQLDGPIYQRFESARDRDRLRPSVLARAGWHLHRIWAPDWVRFRAREIERLLAALRSVQNETPGATAVQLETVPEVTVQVEDANVDEPAADNFSLPEWAKPFEPVSDELLSPVRGANLLEVGSDDLAKILQAMAEQESGIHKERAFSLLMDASCAKRMGGRIRDHLDAAVAVATRCGAILLEGDFLIPVSREVLPQLANGPNVDVRPIGHVPPGELAAAMAAVLQGAGTTDRSDLTQYLARIYGVRRLSAANRALLEEVLDDLVEAGAFTKLEDGRVRCVTAKAEKVEQVRRQKQDSKAPPTARLAANSRLVVSEWHAELLSCSRVVAMSPAEREEFDRLAVPIINVLASKGGTLGRGSLAEALGIPGFRMRQVMARVGEWLHVDGQPVIPQADSVCRLDSARLKVWIGS